MLLSEFRELTAHLDGDLELTASGGEVAIVITGEKFVTIDDDASYHFPVEEGSTVLWAISDDYD